MVRKFFHNYFLVAFWLAVPALAACASASSPEAATLQVTPPQSSDLTRVEGRVALQGRPAASEISMEVFSISDEVTVETVAEGLEVPWELDFAPDGRIFVTERPGRIRIVQDGVLQTTPFATLEQVASVSESGLMGLALHPDFADNRQLFICYTYRNEDDDLRNRVARLTDDNGAGAEHQTILDDIPGDSRHDGCRLGFGPDSKLYVTMGDATEAEAAQDLDSLSGKVLRLEANGSVPSDNPFPGSYVFTYGHRNSQGIDWHPTTGDLFITEHGPDRDDEINILESGSNYGWPEVTGPSDEPEYSDPILSLTPPPAIAGAAFYTGDKLPPSWEGDLVFAALRASHLQRVKLQSPDFRKVTSSQILFDEEFGRLRAVALSPDGYLYFTTSNRDGRGDPSSEDDRILRIVPAPSTSLGMMRTDDSGEFTLDLAAGSYRIRWTEPGFLPAEKRLVITGDEEVNVDLGEVQLDAGDASGDGRTRPDHVAPMSASSDQSTEEK